MNFNYPGYSLNFIQKKQIKDGTDHLFSYIYKFTSPVTGYKYVLTADLHKNDFFAIKFYPKSLKRSEHKYHIITNKGDLGNILITCLKVIPQLMADYPFASFGFAGSPSFDKKSKRLEGLSVTQRFNVYRYLALKKIGNITFEHYEYEEVSGYMVINRKCPLGVVETEKTLRTMLSETYNGLPIEIIDSLTSS